MIEETKTCCNKTGENEEFCNHGDWSSWRYKLFLNRCFEATANASMVCSSLYSVPSCKAGVVSFYEGKSTNKLLAWHYLSANLYVGKTLHYTYSQFIRKRLLSVLPGSL